MKIREIKKTKIKNKTFWEVELRWEDCSYTILISNNKETLEKFIEEIDWDESIRDIWDRLDDYDDILEKENNNFVEYEEDILSYFNDR